MKLSVVISTYNRHRQLEKCLTSLIDQKDINASFYEILVIDNNSTIDTKNVFIKKSEIFKNLKYFQEKKQGLSWCRNKGIKEASGSLIAFIDDDAIAEENWISNILKFSARHPNVGVFGGPFSRYCECNVPKWLPDEFGSFSLGTKIKNIKLGENWLCGGNIIFRKTMFNKYGIFDTELGMKGTSINYGEETEMIARILSKGEKAFFVPQIKIKHLIQPYKMKLSWHIKSNFKGGMTHWKVNKKNKNIPSCLYGILVSLLRINKNAKNIFQQIYYKISSSLYWMGALFG